MSQPPPPPPPERGDASSSLATPEVREDPVARLGLVADALGGYA